MRIALGIEYNGAAYFGWQRQKEVNSVQEELEIALSRIANEPISIQCAGRTDAGVHATAQLVHFDTNAQRKEVAWTLGVNSNLPADIAVTWAKPVPDEFHARFTATARRYRYIIHNARFRGAILGNGLSHYHGDLDVSLMAQGGQHLIGEQDFTSFRALHCQSKSPHRQMHHLRVTRQGPYVIIDIKANAFLHHMVRNIAGSLLEVGKGNQDPQWIKTLLDAKDRSQAAATAKAGGLYLVEVDYPQQFELPKSHVGPLFLTDD